mmetsp:Transcript_56362/g.121450  ORF Transcript_56362/g.121450 Transcript_56362/m.121450 type:complete len:220 (+) Transcript_56362:407-1066(+)
MPSFANLSWTACNSSAVQSGRTKRRIVSRGTIRTSYMLSESTATRLHLFFEALAFEQDAAHSAASLSCCFRFSWSGMLTTDVASGFSSESARASSTSARMSSRVLLQLSTDSASAVLAASVVATTSCNIGLDLVGVTVASGGCSGCSCFRCGASGVATNSCHLGRDLVGVIIATGGCSGCSCIRCGASGVATNSCHLERDLIGVTVTDGVCSGCSCSCC